MEGERDSHTIKLTHTLPQSIILYWFHSNKHTHTNRIHILTWYIHYLTGKHTIIIEKCIPTMDGEYRKHKGDGETDSEQKRRIVKDKVGKKKRLSGRKWKKKNGCSPPEPTVPVNQHCRRSLDLTVEAPNSSKMLCYLVLNLFHGFCYCRSSPEFWRDAKKITHLLS